MEKINYPNIKNCYEISSHGNFKNININKPFVNHKDGNKINNHINNL
jgi:hypothetical protein